MVPPRSLTSRCDCHQRDDRVVALGRELGAVGVGQPADVAGELDDRHLQAEADAEERQAVLARLADRLDHALDAAHAEAARAPAARRSRASSSPARRLVGEAVARRATRSRRRRRSRCRRGSAPPARSCRRRAGRCTCRPPRCAPARAGARIALAPSRATAARSGSLVSEPQPLAHLAVESLLVEAERDLVDRLRRRGSR